MCPRTRLDPWLPSKRRKEESRVLDPTQPNSLSVLFPSFLVDVTLSDNEVSSTDPSKNFCPHARRPRHVDRVLPEDTDIGVSVYPCTRMCRHVYVRGRDQTDGPYVRQFLSVENLRCPKRQHASTFSSCLLPIFSPSCLRNKKVLFSLQHSSVIQHIESHEEKEPEKLLTPLLSLSSFLNHPSVPRLHHLSLTCSPPSPATEFLFSFADSPSQQESGTDNEDTERKKLLFAFRVCG